jgi:hypothetical protein
MNSAPTNGGNVVKKRLNQKVGLILFPIWGAGGLATDVAHYRRLLRSADHKADFWQIQYSDSKHLQTGKLTLGTGADGPTAAQGYLSITDKNLKSTIKTLNQYDILMFLHPCPHITDTQKAVANWSKLYTETTVERKIVRFTDVYLEKLYPWIMDVKDEFEAWATNAGQLRWVKKYLPECQLSTYPMEFRNQGLYPGATEIDLVWPCAWRGWKGIKQFVHALPRFTGSYELYGSGRELRQFRKAGNPIVEQCHGAVKPGRMLAAFARSRASIDLTGFSPKYYGHNNRTVIEPMFHGAVSCVQDKMQNPHNEIPPECVYTVDKEFIAQDLNALVRDRALQARIAAAAFDWARWRYKGSRVLGEILYGDFDTD